MGILVIVIATIPKSFQIIIHHRSNSISKLFLLVCFAPFRCFCLFVPCWFSYTLSMFFFFFLFVSCYNEPTLKLCHNLRLITLCMMNIYHQVFKENLIPTSHCTQCHALERCSSKLNCIGVVNL